MSEVDRRYEQFQSVIARQGRDLADLKSLVLARLATIPDAFAMTYGYDEEVQDVNGFTNTSYADLDALTAAAFTNPVIVTLDTDTAAQIAISNTTLSINTSGACFLAYRVSGASSIAASDANAARSDDTGRASVTFVHTITTLTPGSNTFELQARVTANNGRITNPRIGVVAL